MKKDTLETLIKEAVTLLDKPGKKPSCPKEEAIADYINGRLPRREMDKLERHFLTCVFCLEQMMISNRLLREGEQKEEKVSASVLEQAVRLFPSQKKKPIIEDGRKILVEILEKGKDVIR